MGPQRVVTLTPPLLRHHHNAPSIADFFLFEPIHFHGEAMIRACVAAAMTGPANAGNAPGGCVWSRLAGGANRLPSKQESPVTDAMFIAIESHNGD